jgi:stage III sporulation protein AB
MPESSPLDMFGGEKIPPCSERRVIIMGTAGILKILAALSSIGIGTAAGLYFSYRLKMREESLHEIIRALREMSLLIRYRALTVHELFRELSRYEFINSVVKSGEELPPNIPSDFRGGWSEAADGLTELERGERGVIKSIGLSLGTSDTEGQLSMLEVNLQLLSKYKEEAREEYIKKGKLYRSFGLLAGMFIAVVII